MDVHKIEKGAQLILQGLGCNLKDRNYMDTPERFAKVMQEMFVPPDSNWAVFPEEYNDFILLRDHKLYTLCPHHLLPVKLYVSIAYIPQNNVLGLSKLARLAHECNRQPVLQERFTAAILDRLNHICKGVQGAACLVQGKQGCTEMRGIRSDAHFFTYKFSGEFEKNERLQDRFFALAKSNA